MISEASAFLLITLRREVAKTFIIARKRLATVIYCELLRATFIILSGLATLREGYGADASFPLFPLVSHVYGFSLLGGKFVEWHVYSGKGGKGGKCERVEKWWKDQLI